MHFLERNPQGTIDSRTIRIGCNTASDVGTYTFKLSGKGPGTTEILTGNFIGVLLSPNQQRLGPVAAL